MIICFVKGKARVKTRATDYTLCSIRFFHDRRPTMELLHDDYQAQRASLTGKMESLEGAKDDCVINLVF
jgi:hypothetical protein